MNTVDLPKLQALLACATDIWTVKIPEVRAKHGHGEQVELAVVDMLFAAGDCLGRAVVLLEEDGRHASTVEHLRHLMRGVLCQIDACRAEAEGWRIASAVTEAAKAVKH